MLTIFCGFSFCSCSRYLKKKVVGEFVANFQGWWRVWDLFWAPKFSSVSSVLSALLTCIAYVCCWYLTDVRVIRPRLGVTYRHLIITACPWVTVHCVFIHVCGRLLEGRGYGPMRTRGREGLIFAIFFADVLYGLPYPFILFWKIFQFVNF